MRAGNKVVIGRLGCIGDGEVKFVGGCGVLSRTLKGLRS